MKNLNDLLEEIKKINKEDKESPIFDYERLEVNYRKVNKIEKITDTEEFEKLLREYIIIWKEAEVYNFLYEDFDLPLDKYTTREDWDNRNTNGWYQYQEIMRVYEKMRKIEKVAYKKIINEWR